MKYPPARLFVNKKEDCVKRSPVLDHIVTSGVELEAERGNVLVKLVTSVDLEMIILIDTPCGMNKTT